MPNRARHCSIASASIAARVPDINEALAATQQLAEEAGVELARDVIRLSPVLKTGRPTGDISS